jgi:hypothetical protein
MRLTKVEHGHAYKYRMILGAVGLSVGRAPDILRVLLYRPEYFGKAFGRLLQEALRGDSFWTVGERELFAAYTSVVNECEF